MKCLHVHRKIKLLSILLLILSLFVSYTHQQDQVSPSPSHRNTLLARADPTRLRAPALTFDDLRALSSRHRQGNTPTDRNPPPPTQTSDPASTVNQDNQNDNIQTAASDIKKNNGAVPASGEQRSDNSVQALLQNNGAATAQLNNAAQHSASSNPQQDGDSVPSIDVSDLARHNITSPSLQHAATTTANAAAAHPPSSTASSSPSQQPPPQGQTTSSSSKHLLDITDSALQSHIDRLGASKDVWSGILLNYCSPDAPQCRGKHEEMYNQIGEEMRFSDGFTVGNVNCDREFDLCDQQDISVFPTVRLILKGAKSSREQISVDGEYSVDGILSFVEQHVSLNHQRLQQAQQTQPQTQTQPPETVTADDSLSAKIITEPADSNGSPGPSTIHGSHTGSVDESVNPAHHQPQHELTKGVKSSEGATLGAVANVSSNVSAGSDSVKTMGDVLERLKETQLPAAEPLQPIFQNHQVDAAETIANGGEQPLRSDENIAEAKTHVLNDTDARNRDSVSSSAQRIQQHHQQAATPAMTPPAIDNDNEAQYITDMTSKNFLSTISSTNATFIHFYLPSCQSSLRARLHVEDAAKAVNDDVELSGSVTFAEVDCENQLTLCEQLEIHSLPTHILYVRNSSSYHTLGKWDKELTADVIVAFIERYVELPTVSYMNSKEDLNILLSYIDSEVHDVQSVVVACYSDAPDPTSTNIFRQRFYEIAKSKSNNHIIFAYTNDPSVCPSLALSSPVKASITIYDGKQHPYTVDSADDFSVEELNQQVHLISIPVYDVLNTDNYHLYQELRTPVVYVFTDISSTSLRSKQYTALFTELGNEYRNTLTLVRLDIHQSKHELSYFNISSVDSERYDTIIVAEYRDDQHKHQSHVYPYKSQIIDYPHLKKFLEEFIHHTLPSPRLSQPIPTTAPATNAPITLVGATFDTYIQQQRANGKHVFLNIYSQHCAHCKRLAPIWKELAEHVNQQSNSNVVIAELDGSLNDIDIEYHKFPALIMLTADGKSIEYRKQRTLHALKQFISTPSSFMTLSPNLSRPDTDAALRSSVDIDLSTERKPELLRQAAIPGDRYHSRSQHDEL